MIVAAAARTPRPARWRTSLVRALMVVGLLAGACTSRAWAYELTGRWIAGGTTDQGGAFGYRYAFGPDGSFQSEMDVGDVPGQSVSTAGVMRCVGAYRFDGRSIETRVTACQNCTASGCAPSGPVPFPQGAVTFQGPNVLVVGGFTLQRE